jgi:hypothetical protein
VLDTHCNAARAASASISSAESRFKRSLVAGLGVALAPPCCFPRIDNVTRLRVARRCGDVEVVWRRRHGVARQGG